MSNVFIKSKYSPGGIGAAMAVLLILVALLVWPGAPSVIAQEQQPQEILQTAGPYEVGVSTERSNLSVGRARFILTVDDSATGQPVTGAQILIRTKHQAEGTEGWSAAFAVPQFPGTYHAQIRLDSPGVYLVSIDVDGPLGEGTALVEPLQVPDLRGYSSGSFVFIGMTMFLVGGAAYVWWSATRQNRLRKSSAQAEGEAPNAIDQQQDTSGPGGPGGGG